MAAKETTPRRWGGLRRWESGEKSFGHLRRQIDALHQEMEQLFDDMSRQGFRKSGMPDLRDRGQIALSIDETEDEKAFHVSIEMPGLDKDDIDVSLSGRMLTIKGEKKSDKKQEGKDYYRRERVFGAFRRSIELPGDVDAAKIDASFRNGVLTIDLPKTKEARSRVKHIEVKAA